MPPDAEALAHDLDHWLAGETILARPSAPWERAVKWARRNPAIAALLGMVILVSIAGLGNPKNVKSLVWAHQTPPAMAMGVRAKAEIAVRAGIRHILFTEQPEPVPTAIDAYLKALQPVPSPHAPAPLHARFSVCARCWARGSRPS